MKEATTLSISELQLMRSRTLSAIRAQFGDHPLFGILDNVEKMLSGVHQTKHTVNGNAINGVISANDYVRDAAHTYLVGKSDLEASEIVKGLRDEGTSLPVAEKKAVFKLAALMAKDKSRFEKIKGKAPTYRTTWKAL